MTTTGQLRGIHVAPEQGAPTRSIETARALAGRGLEGDRYCLADPETDDQSDDRAGGTFADRDGSDLTLIETEALAAVERDYDIALEPGVHRRNLTTEGVALNHLDGERFRVGDVVCEGVELCEPCSYLERHLAEDGVREALVHRGGLRARILEGGVLTVGDRLERH
ncbi:MOSC domain-containing protein [Natronococcus amylolyticus DSM 10524]|uniref:MOSC domain-containing protein n=1 Tax=Natronococcus amylolyticus DSM 10524 TaxID=1227497 RepID=L9XIZ4_9EURY|nr:MOSC domain-containing protein [Natronococcus amylolyticus]ELY61724.1 MOSC domain-containing protein [Natronococcus amylolyticus DSM 10524]